MVGGVEVIMHVLIIFLGIPILLGLFILIFLLYGLLGLFIAAMILIGLLEFLICRIYRKRTQKNIHAGFQIIAWVSFISGIVYMVLLVRDFTAFINILTQPFR